MLLLHSETIYKQGDESFHNIDGECLHHFICDDGTLFSRGKEKRADENKSMIKYTALSYYTFSVMSLSRDVIYIGNKFTSCEVKNELFVTYSAQ